MTPEDVRQILADPAETGHGERGNPRAVGMVRGRRIRVVVALDDPGFVITVHEEGAVNAEYDSEANALRIDLIPRPVAATGEGDGRYNVALDEREKAISVELLYPDMGLEPLSTAAERYGLDEQALMAAARAALAAPDREIRLEVGVRSLA